MNRRAACFKKKRLYSYFNETILLLSTTTKDKDKQYIAEETLLQIKQMKGKKKEKKR